MIKVLKAIVNYFSSKKTNKTDDISNFEIMDNIMATNNKILSNNEIKEHVMGLFKRQMDDVLKLTNELYEISSDNSLSLPEVDNRISEKLKQEPTIFISERDGSLYEDKIWLVSLGNIFIRERLLNEDETKEYKEIGCLKSMGKDALKFEFDKALKNEDYERCAKIKAEIDGKF